jgi:hypothetical protein
VVYLTAPLSNKPQKNLFVEEPMFRRSFVARMVAVIVFLSVVAVGGFMAFRAGEARGYAVGVTTAQQLQSQPNGQSQVAPAVPMAPGMPYAYPGYFYGYRPHFFSPFGLLLFPLGLLFFFFFVGGLFRFMLWGAVGRGHWRHHHGPWNGPHGPWGQPGTGEQPGPAAEQPAKPAE